MQGKLLLKAMLSRTKFRARRRWVESEIQTLYTTSLFGDIAQLIRALRWQRRGPGFESPYLHQTEASTNVGLFYSMDGFFSLDDGFRIF